MRPYRSGLLTAADFDRAYAFAAVDLLQNPPVEGQPVKPVQLFHWGVNERVDGRPPIVIDEAFAAGMEGNFASRKGDLPIDYNHASLAGFQDAPAAGWIAALKVVRPGQETSAGLAAGVWLQPQWTPEGLRRIRDREYRYMSAVIRRDMTTGEVLPEILGAGVTNNPAIDGLQAVAASARPPAKPAGLSASNAGGGQRAFSCSCGWRGAMTPVKGGRFGVSISDREGVYDFCSRQVAENAIEQLASDHREMCPKARGE